MASWQLFADLIGEAQVCFQQADQGSRHYGKIARATGFYSGKLKDLLGDNRPYFDWIIAHYNEDGHLQAHIVPPLTLFHCAFPARPARPQHHKNTDLVMANLASKGAYTAAVQNELRKEGFLLQLLRRCENTPDGRAFRKRLVSTDTATTKSIKIDEVRSAANAAYTQRNYIGKGNRGST